MKAWVRAWYFSIWPQRTQRFALAGEYRALAGSKYLLTDIAVRNHVFRAGPAAQNLYEAGIAEGRRRAAIDIIDMSRVDPMEIASIEIQLPTRGAGHAD
jgi:hypothetical protein